MGYNYVDVESGSNQKNMFYVLFDAHLGPKSEHFKVKYTRRVPHNQPIWNKSIFSNN